jgi:hypothetical protein
LGTSNALYEASKDIVTSSHRLTDRQVMSILGKRALVTNGRILLGHPFTATVFFGGVIGWNTAKEMWYVLNTSYKTSESAT